MVLIDILTGIGQLGHTLALLALLLLLCLAVLVAWVLVLLLLPGCRRRQPEVRGGAGYLPGRPASTYPARGWHEWHDASPARARGRHA